MRDGFFLLLITNINQHSERASESETDLSCDHVQQMHTDPQIQYQVTQHQTRLLRHTCVHIFRFPRQALNTQGSLHMPTEDLGVQPQAKHSLFPLV